VSAFPNVPTRRGHDFDGRVAQAVNHLLNQITFFQFVIEDQPTAGESILLTQFPVELPLVSTQCSGWAATAASSDAVFTLTVGGSSAGTITFPAGEQDGVVVLTTTTIPADTDFEIVAPTPQDATLADITLTLAASL
jgi:hypothetical protein